MTPAATVESVAIVDDQPAARDVLKFVVVDANFEPKPIEGPLPALEKFADQLVATADSAVCDQLLMTREYAKFNGAELVSVLYDRKFPAVLCTDYEDTMADDIRRYRSKVPVLLRPAELTEDSLAQSLEVCIRELDCGYSAKRKPWRAQIRILDAELDRNRVYVEVPAWSDQMIRLDSTDIPVDITARFTPEFRCFAEVNLGAEKPEELFFRSWELAS